MKYADKQLVRPQSENGCDYGHGRRSVLVRAGKKEILHVAGQKHWGGIGADRHYSTSEIVAYPDEKGTCKQRTLAEGRMTKQKWEEIRHAIYTHLGHVGFDIGLINLQHTLLLDEPGEITGPPPSMHAYKKKEHPRIESNTLYRIFLEDSGKCNLVGFPITKQVNGVIVYKLASGREVDKRAKQLIEEGCAGTIEGATEAYLRYFKEQSAEANLRLQRAAESFSYHKDNLTEAEHRIEAMLKELSHDDQG